jgi:hypothetical protein
VRVRAWQRGETLGYNVSVKAPRGVVECFDFAGENIEN